MIYNETYIGVATNVAELMDILRTKVPGVIPEVATIEQASGDRSPDVEVWYDEGTNTVILK